MIEIKSGVLQQNQLLLEAIFNKSNDAILLANNEGQYIGANPAASRLFGFSEEEFLNLKITDLIVDKTVDFPKSWDQFMHQKGKDGTIRMRRKDGRVIKYRYNATAKILEGVHMAILRDLSDILDLEEKLVSSEQLFRSTFENAAVGMALINATGHYTDVNSSFCEMVGYSREELLKMNFLQITHPTDIAEDQRTMSLMQSIGERNGYREKRYIHKKGEVVWASTKISVVRDDNDRFLSFVSQIENITKRKEIYQVLKRSEQRYKSLFEHNPTAVFSVNQYGFFVNANKTVEAILGYKLEELYHLHFSEICAPEDRERVGHLFTRAIDGESFHFETGTIDRSGGRRELKIHNMPIMVDGKIEGVHCIAFDITESKKSKLNKELIIKISEIFTEDRNTAECLRALLYEFCNRNPAMVAAEAWVYGLDREHLGLITFYSKSGEAMGLNEKTKFANGHGLVGTVWETGKQKFIANPASSPQYERKSFAKKNNLQAVLGVPLLLNTKVIGVLVFYLKENTFPILNLEFNSTIVEHVAREIIRKKEEDDRKQFWSMTPDLVCIVDATGRICKANQAFSNLLDYKISFLQTQTIDSFIHPDDQAAAHQVLKKPIEGTPVFNFESRVVTSNGEIKYLIWNAVPLIERGFLLASGRDVTAVRQIEKKVLIEQQRFSKMFEEANVSMCILKGKSHVFTNANTEYYRLTNQTTAILGKPLIKVFPELREQGFIRLLDQVYKTGESYIGREVEFEITGSTGIPIKGYINFMYQAYKNEHGLVEGVFFLAVDITEQVLARKKIEESEARFRVFFEQASVGVANIDINGKFIRVNDKFCKMFGYTHDDFSKMTLLELTHPEDLADSKLNLEKLIKGEIKTLQITKRRYRKDGTMIWVKVFVSAIFGQDKRPVSFVTIMNDITEEKEVQIKLLESAQKITSSEKMLAQSQKIAHIGSWNWVVDSDTVTWSDELYRIYGMEPQSVKISFDRYIDFIHPDDRKRVNELIQRALQDHQPYSFYSRIVRPDGEERVVHSHGEVIVNKRREISMHGVIADVTDQKRNEEELDKLSWIAKETINAVIITGKNGLVEWVNEGFERITEYSAEEAIGKKISQLLYGKETDPEIRKYIKKQISKIEPFTCELIMYSKSGRVIYVETEGHPIFDENGAFTHYFNMDTDITERKKVYDELLKKEMEIRNFAKQLNQILEDERARIGREIHDEFGQQLTGLKMSLSTIKKGKLDSENHEIIKDMIKSIDISVKAIRQFSNELRPIILDTLGLTPAIEWLVHEFEKRTSIRYTYQLTTKQKKFNQELSTAYFRICQESLTNVAKHARATQVSIRLFQEKRNLVLEIKDNGKGFGKINIGKKSTMGLLGMRERAKLINAQLIISSNKSGTCVQLSSMMS